MKDRCRALLQTAAAGLGLTGVLPKGDFPGDPSAGHMLVVAGKATAQLPVHLLSSQESSAPAAESQRSSMHGWIARSTPHVCRASGHLGPSAAQAPVIKLVCVDIGE